jgi:branched-chain amino acid transport system substrate-binding protein
MRVRAVILAAALVTAAILAISPAHAEILIATASAMTGRLAWYGEQYQRGTELALETINAGGGLLGQRVELTVGDDACEDEHGVALARSLIERHVVAVIGHTCSGAAVAAAPIYEAAQVVMISGSATNPALTEAGRPNVFRTIGRDDLQGRLAGDYLAARHRDERIAVLFQEDVYVRGLANETRRRLHELGIREVLFHGFAIDGHDWDGLVRRLQAEGITVAYFPGRSPDVALLARHAGAAGYSLRIIGADSLNSEDFWLVAGEAGEGIVFSSAPDARLFPTAAAVVERFRRADYEPEGYTLYVYAAVEAWAAAVKKAGTLEPRVVMRVLHEAEFDTILGRIGFDEKGDVTGITGFAWFIWRGGRYEPLEESRTE